MPTLYSRKWMQQRSCALLFALCLTLSLSAGKSTVFILSLDGWRHDYTDRAATPFIDTFIETGAYSHEVIPNFPSVTFQSHVAIATGAPAAVHGITGNTFYDNRTRQTYRYAGSAALLEAEPIWTTATRQGVRTLVLDWVNSHQQNGPYASAYYLDGYTRGISDRERIGRVLETWKNDEHTDPLRLVLAYGESPDKEGHRFGPDSDRITQTVAALDAYVKEIYKTALSIWKRTREPGDVFYFMLLSDHGMSPITHLVDLAEAAGLQAGDGTVRLTTGTVGHLFFDQIEDPKRRQQQLESAYQKLKKHPFLNVYMRESLPSNWDYHHPYRTGDLVVELHNHHAFRAGLSTVIREVDPDSHFLGTHGYDPDKDRDMHTVLYLQRYPEPLGGISLGTVSLLQIHATIARLLGIEPARTARQDSVIRDLP